jgi:hypothetical protein
MEEKIKIVEKIPTHEEYNGLRELVIKCLQG